MGDFKVLVMCGGKGRRMEGAGGALPKVLVEVSGRSLLAHKVAGYRRQGVEEFVFCVGHEAGLVREAVAQLGVKAEFSDLGLEAGILKRLHGTRELMSEPTVVGYGDTFAELDLADLVRHHEESGCLATVVAAAIANPFGLVEWNEEGRVTRFNEKPVLNHYIGYLVLSPRVFEALPPTLLDLPDGEGLVRAFQVLLALGELGAYRFDGLQVTVNTPRELDEARERLGQYFTMQENTHEK